LLHSGIQKYNYNREIYRLRYLETIFDTVKQVNRTNNSLIHYESLDYPGLKLENLYFNFLIILFGFIISFIFLIIDIISFRFVRNNN
jgi:hypothetical protein